MRGIGALAGSLLAGMLLLPESAAARTPEPGVRCSIEDPRLDELSGLVVAGDRWYAVNDGGTQVEVFVLDTACRVQDVIARSTDPYDVEDLALAADGTLWLGDTGDNRKKRPTVALHAVDPAGDTALYRLTYPDGAHDAEALLLDRSGTPYIITKDILGQAGVYRPAGPLASPGPTPLERVGTLRMKATDTPGGPVGSLGSVLVTGAASTRDGSVIAVRTYTDAYLYPVPDGDVVAALKRQPVRVPLPNEQQGEAIAFTGDGTLLSAGEGVGTPVRAVPGAVALASGGDVSPAGQSSPATVEPADAASQGTQDGPVADRDGDQGLPMLPGAVVAVLIAAVAVFGVSRWRRR